MKKLDALWDGKIRPGFEMLVDNFSAGIVGASPGASSASSASARSSSAFTRGAGNGVDFLVDNDLLPLTSIVIEPAKVLFLNNAINHGVLTPLGTTQALETGKSILFLLEANPGPGLGLLLAFIGLRQGRRQGVGPGCGDHPVLRRHPRDLLPVRADEAQADPGHHPRRHDRRLHQRRCSDRGPACTRRTRLDHRRLRADRQRQLPRRHAVGVRRGRGVVRGGGAACSRPTAPPTRPTWRPPPPRWRR